MPRRLLPAPVTLTAVMLLATACADDGGKSDASGSGITDATDDTGSAGTTEVDDTDDPEDSGDTGETGTTEPVDADGDGFTADEDCDDTDELVFPGAEEVCGDGIDNNCDARTDEACPIALADADAVLLGERSNDYAGYAVSTVGDVNGDGFDDLVVGAYRHNASGAQEGAAYVVFGPVPSEVRVLGDLPGVKLSGVTAREGAGKMVRGIGDIDGDGLEDILVGANEADSDRFDSVGWAALFTGAQLSEASGELSLEDAQVIVEGPTAYSWLSGAITPAGDVDLDGVPDVWISATGARAGAHAGGEVYLFTGAQLAASVGSGRLSVADATTTLRGTEEGAYFGAKVLSPGDLDGDGIDDVVVGVPLSSRSQASAGRIYVFSGASRGVVEDVDADAILNAASGGDALGASLAAAGDMTGDGIADLWVGANRVDTAYADAGAAYLVPGGSALFGAPQSIDDVWQVRLLGAAAGDGLGASLAGGVDLDGDGIHDLVAGMPNRGTSREGAVAVVSGAVNSTVDVLDAAIAVYVGESSDDRAGFEVALGEDLLGAGGPTLVVSSWEADRSAQDAGAVYLLGL